MFKKSKGYLFAILLCIVSVFSLIFSACKEGVAEDPITGITASITQTEEIYETDALTKLQPMLTVKTKSESGQEEVTTQYTLEGEFVEGNSVITVIYKPNTSFTATVTVNVSKAAHYHMYGAWEILAQPTCETDGYMERSCSCGETQKQSIKASGHAYGEWQTIEPTCTTEGEKYRVCGYDSTHIDSEVIKAKGHTDVIDAAQEATCTMAGKTEGTHCSVCGTVTKEQERIAPKGHEFGDWYTVTESTETVKGSQRRDCVNCEAYETDELPLKGHEYQFVEKIDPTCTERGYSIYQCVDCKDIDERDFVDATNHDLNVQVVDPTCETDGYKVYNCKNCTLTYTADFKAAMGHNYDEWFSEKAANCMQSGSQRQNCLNCDHYQTREIAKLEHRYILVAVSQTQDEEFQYVYQCEYCHDEIITNEGGDFQDYQAAQLFEQAPDFKFIVVSEGTEEDIKKNLSVINEYYLDTEYETYKSVVQNYAVTKLDGVENAWVIAPNNDTTELDEKGIPYYESQYYVEGETFVARTSGNVALYGYYDPNNELQRCFGDTLTFSIAADETKNVVELNSSGKGQVLFLRTLENHNPGYYPYDLTLEDTSGYLTLQKIDGISVGDILFIGEAEAVEDILALVDEECAFGKVEEIHRNEFGEFVLFLSCPELDEVFSNLNVGFDQQVDFSEYPEIEENLETQAVDALYASEDFAKFIATADMTVQRYYAERQLAATPLTKSNFADKVTIDKPSLKVNGTQIEMKLGGHFKSEVKTKSGKEIGKFTIDFTVESTVGFNVSVDFKVKYRWFIPTGVKYFDIRLTQTDSFKLDFEVKFDVDYELNKEELTQKYVYHKDSLKIHTKECIYIKDTVEEKLGEIKAEELSSYAKKEGYSTCLICKPVEGLNRAAFIINTATNIVHCYNCYDVEEQMNEENKKLFYGNINSLDNKGYEYCQRCKPQLRDKQDFEKEMLSTLEYADWGEKVNQITEWAKNSGSEEYKSKGMKLCNFNFKFAWVCTANFELRLVLKFDFEASLEYHYHQAHENSFGVRVQSGKLKTYTTQKTTENTSELTLMGSLDFKVGVQADVYVSIIGLSKWMRAGFTAEAGLYLELDGIVHISNDTSVNNYAAARFEAGPYVDVSAYYKVFKWNGDVTIYSNKFPIFAYGYDKAYYGYVNETPEDVIEISDKETYVMDLTDLLSVHYYDVQEHKTAQEVLKTKETLLYKVVFDFENDDYWTVKDNKLSLSDKALCEFEDTLTIRIKGNTTWKKYVKGSAVFYLDEITIKFAVKDGEGHQYEEVAVTPKNCLEDGSIVRKCQKCPDIRVEIIPASHEPIAVERKDPTCLETGYTEGERCEVCEEILTGIETLLATGHTFKDGACVTCGALDGKGFCYLKKDEPTNINSVVIFTAQQAETYYAKYPDFFTDAFKDTFSGDYFDANVLVIFSYRTDKLGSIFTIDTEGDYLTIQNGNAILNVTESIQCGDVGYGETALYDTVCVQIRKDDFAPNATATVNIDTVVENEGHVYALLTFDFENHWYVCYCGAENEGSREAHKDGTATCLEVAKCSVCNQPYGELGEHVYEDGRCVVCECVEDTAIYLLGENSWGELPCTIVRTFEEANEYYTNYPEFFTEEFMEQHDEAYFRSNVLTFFSYDTDKRGPVFRNVDVTIDGECVILRVEEDREEYCVPKMSITMSEYNVVCAEMTAKSVAGCSCADVAIDVTSVTILHEFKADICVGCGEFSGAQHTITLKNSYNNDWGEEWDPFIVDEYSISYTVIALDTLTLPTIQHWEYAEYNHFLGWYTSMTATNPFDVMTLKDNPIDIELYAKWDLCTVYDSIDSTPWSMSGRTILDWSKETDTNLLNHTNRSVLGTRYNNIDIVDTAQEVIFIGDPAKMYTNFRMYLCCFKSGQPLTIRLKDFNFITNEMAAIEGYEDAGVALTIDVAGQCSIGTSYAGGSIIKLPKNTVTFTGNGNLIMRAGNGADGASAGANGMNGGVAVIVNELIVDMTGNLFVYGGNGGNGAAGANGADGSGNDAPGNPGGQGGNGGLGGSAITCNSLITASHSNITLYGGYGGNGGKGGNGGNGTRDSAPWSDGANKGGNGGNGGNGGACSDILVVSKTSIEGAVTYVNAFAGAGGVGGNGGNGGAGNTGFIGGPGGDGGQAGKGGMSGDNAVQAASGSPGAQG